MKEKRYVTATALSLLVLAALAFPLQAASTAVVGLPFPLIERFDSFTMKDGIPSHKVHCVLPGSDGKLWVGTYKGLLVREDGKFRKIGTEDGLTHPMIMCLAEDPRSGDLWIGTMRGLNRYSAGRITTFRSEVPQDRHGRRLDPSDDHVPGGGSAKRRPLDRHHARSQPVQRRAHYDLPI